jgi:hypothetical protein
MSTTALVRERFDMGRVIGRTFGAIGRNAVTFLVLAVVFYGVPNFLLQWLQGKVNPVVSAGGVMFRYAGLWVAFALISWILSALMQAAVIHGVVADADRRKASIGDCLATGVRHALPVAGVGLISGIGIGFALLLFIVPGLMLMMAWIVAVPAVVAERTGVFGALSRSGDLTRGHRWSIFALAFVAFVVAMMVGSVLTAISFGFGALGANPLAQATSLPSVVATSVSGALMSIVSAAGVASIYVELRTIKDGLAPSTLASVFD